MAFRIAAKQGVCAHSHYCGYFALSGYRVAESRNQPDRAAAVGTLAGGGAGYGARCAGAASGPDYAGSRPGTCGATLAPPAGRVVHGADTGPAAGIRGPVHH